MTRALIIGAGVAGPVAALALQRAGIEAALYEAHAEGGDDAGAFLTIQSNGLDALRAVGLAGAVTDAGFPTPTLRLVSGTGRHLGVVPNGGTLPDGTVSHTLRRADLHRVLRDEALRRGIPLLYGRRLVDVQTAGGRVRAAFADGTEAQGDLLIGADGVHSRLRTLIDPSAPPARALPVLNVAGRVGAGVSTEARPGEYVMVFGKRAFFGWTVAPDGEIWWFANPPVGDGADQRERLLELFAEDRSPAVELIGATSRPLPAWAVHDLPRVPVWHDRSMIVIGDAAHAASPSSGQGASMAIEDAVVLARCLRDVPGTAAALAAYERLRRARVERVVAHGARTTSAKVVGPVGRVLRDLALPLGLRMAAGRGARSLAWLHEYRVEWDTPVAA